jgi:hypothetical protein
MKDHYFEQASKLISTAQQLNHMLPEGRRVLDLPSPPALTDNYVEQFRIRIRELGFKEAEFTSIPHDRIIEKAVKRTKPFKEKGAGYQDSLIWETILQRVADTTEITYFVTNNVTDFAAEDKKNLHSDLLDDMRQRSIPEDRIQLIPDLGTLIDSLITPDMPAVRGDELSAFRIHLLNDNILKNWISKNADKIIEELELNKDEMNLDSIVRDIESVEVINLERPESFEIDSISELDEETVVVIGTAKIDATLGFSFFNSDGTMPGRRYPFSIELSDRDNHYIVAEMEVRLTLRFVFSVLMKTDEVLDFEVESQTELWGYCRNCGAIEYNDAAEECSSCLRSFPMADIATIRRAIRRGA